MKMSRAIAVASLVVLAAAPAAWAQAKPTVKIGYIPTDSFAALFLLADRHLPAAGITMQKFNAELGYLKYKELQPVGKLFNFAYRDRAVQELGRK